MVCREGNTALEPHSRLSMVQWKLDERGHLFLFRQPQHHPPLSCCWGTGKRHDAHPTRKGAVLHRCCFPTHPGVP